jgi:hypothetical protein
LALVKGEETYIYVYDDVGRRLLLEALREHAANPDLSLNWFDATVLGDRVRRQAAEGELAFPTTRPAL